MRREQAALYRGVQKQAVSCVLCGDDLLAVGLDYCLAHADPIVQRNLRKGGKVKREKSSWKAPKRRKVVVLPYEVAPEWIKVVQSKGWQKGYTATWAKAKFEDRLIPIKGNPRGKGSTHKAAVRSLLKITGKKSNIKLSLNESLNKKIYDPFTNNPVRKGITKKEFVMKKFNSKSKKSDLINWLVKEGWAAADLDGKTNKELLTMVHNQEKPKTKKASKKTSKKVKTQKKVKTKAKASKKAKKVKTQKNRPVADGERTSKPGALQHFRELWTKKKAKQDREKLVESFIKMFGPKARHSCNNYISLAKKSLLKGCPTIVEKDGILTSKGKAN